MTTAAFYDAIRPLFGGRMKQSQVDGVNAILEACMDERLPRQQTAYVLATAFHETGGRMEPVREGFAETDEQAIAIVTKMFNAGRINRNYAEPDLETGKSYYGRGYVQITWKQNYARLGRALNLDLVSNPDLALDPKVACDILVKGMRLGLFTGKSLDHVSEPESSEPDFTNDRAVVNGTDRAVKIGGYADRFYRALEDVDLLQKSRTVKNAKAIQKSSVTKTVIAAGGGILTTASEVVTENTDEILAAGKKGLSLGEILGYSGAAIAVVLIVLLIIDRARAKAIENARREDNETKGM